MAEYIDKDVAIHTIMGQPPDAHYPDWYASQVKAIPAADVVPICQTGCKGCKREYNLVVGSCRLCARFYKDMYDGVE